MPEHTNAHSQPSESSMSSETARKDAARFTAAHPDTVVDAVIITTHYCSGCGLPHLIRIASTTAVPDAVVAILAMAVTDILEMYDDDVSSSGNTTLFGGEV